MMNRHRAFLLVVAFIFLGCASTGGVTATQPLAGPLSNQAVQFEVVSASDATAKYDDALKASLEAGFRDAGVFPNVGEPGDLQMKVTIASFDEGDDMKRNLNLGGEAEIALQVTITDNGGATLAQLTVTGNSARQGETKINGVNTKIGDSLPSRALKAAVEQLVDYVKRGGAES
jgi:Domain of unknown function (DUF4410)